MEGFAPYRGVARIIRGLVAGLATLALVASSAGCLDHVGPRDTVIRNDAASSSSTTPTSNSTAGVNSTGPPDGFSPPSDDFDAGSG